MANEFRVKNGLIVGDLSVDSGGTLTIPDEIIHAGDTDNKIFFGTDSQGFQVNGNAIMGITDGQVTVDGSVTLKERASAPGDNAAYSQLWVKNTGTGQLFFTTDDGTDIQITTSSAVNASGGAANQTLTTGNGISGANSGSDGDFTIAVEAAQTTITSLLAADIKIGEDDQTKIDFETADEIHFYAANVEQVYLADNIFGPQSDSDVDLGTTGVRWKDAFVDSITVTGTVTPASVTLGGHAVNDIDVATEFVDSDEHLMTSAAINDRFLVDLVEDTSPQLGGNLDVNGNSIVSTSNANINIAPNGTGQVTISAQMTSKANVVAVTGTTQLTAAQSGSYVYVTGSGAVELPDNATTGLQYTIFNNKGSNLTVTLGTNNSIVSNWATNAAVADNEATSYVCVSAGNWVQVG